MIDVDERFDPSSPVVNDSLADHHCFGCGDRNPIGLQLRFRKLVDNDGVWAEFTPTRDHEGYLGMVHGGILATMLDEAMSWAITAGGALGVTARMETAFRQPAKIGETLLVIGRISATRRRVIEVEGEILRRDDSKIIASATARFVRVSQEQAQAWQQAYAAADGTFFGQAARRGGR